jgi:hypothetical protein
MNAMAGENTQNETEGGPMWGHFFNSIGHEDSESVFTGSHHAPTDLRSFPSLNEHLQSPHSEVHPNDSASVVDDDPVSVLDGYPRHKGLAVPAGPVLIPVEDGTYVFKFRTPSGRTHRFQARHDDVEHLREIVAGKLATDPFFAEHAAAAAAGEEGEGAVQHPDPGDFLLSYTDADGDTVVITSDHDVTEAVKIARGAGTDRVVLFVQGGKGWAEAGAGKSEAKAAAVTAAAAQEAREVEKAEVVIPVPAPAPVPVEVKEVSGAAAPETVVPPPHVPRHHPHHHHGHGEEVFGIPKDLLLPASIGALAVVIIGVFTISRLTSNNY